MPNQPTAKKLLNTNKKTAAAIPADTCRGSVLGMEVVPAKTAMEHAWPIAPKSMSFRRPTRSMVKMAIKEARKYSVPLSAARSRERKGDSPMLCSKIVAWVRKG